MAVDRSEQTPAVVPRVFPRRTTTTKPFHSCVNFSDTPNGASLTVGRNIACCAGTIAARLGGAGTTGLSWHRSGTRSPLIFRQSSQDDREDIRAPPCNLMGQPQRGRSSRLSGSPSHSAGSDYEQTAPGRWQCGSDSCRGRPTPPSSAAMSGAISLRAVRYTPHPSPINIGTQSACRFIRPCGDVGRQRKDRRGQHQEVQGSRALGPRYLLHHQPRLPGSHSDRQVFPHRSPCRSRSLFRRP